MPPPLMPTQVFHSREIARFLAVMVMTNAEFQDPCQALRVLFNCMNGDIGAMYLLADIKNRLDTLLYQRPDFYEAVKVFRGYVGLREAFEDYGQRKPTLLPVDW